MNETEMKLTPEHQELMEKEVSPLVARATALVINNQDDSLRAQKGVQFIKQKYKFFFEKFNPAVRAAKLAHTAAKDLENYFLGPFKQAESILRNKICKHELAEKKKRDAADQKAEADRQQKEREASEKLEEKALDEAGKGNKEKAEVLMEQAEEKTIAPTPQPPSQTVAGTSFKGKWKAKVVNEKLVCEAIGSGLIPSTVIMFKQAELDRLAALYKKTLKVKGLEFYEDINMNVRTK